MSYRTLLLKWFFWISPAGPAANSKQTGLRAFQVQLSGSKFQEPRLPWSTEVNPIDSAPQVPNPNTDPEKGHRMTGPHHFSSHVGFDPQVPNLYPLTITPTTARKYDCTKARKLESQDPLLSMVEKSGQGAGH